MKMPSQPAKPSVVIPRTPLGAKLDEAAQIKLEMTELLRELEHKATGRSVEKPGGWRHDPERWLKSHQQPD